MVAWWRGGEMPTLEERVAYLEGRTEEHAAAIGEVRNDIRELRSEMIRRFEEQERRLDGRFSQIDARFNHADTRFNWLVGLQFATLLGVLSVVFTAYFRAN